MKRRIRICILVLLLSLLCACKETPTEPFRFAEYTFADTTFIYDGAFYDVSTRVPSINAITSVETVGRKLVIECHVGPKNSVYCIFDAERGAFDKDIFGCNLTWHANDISTAVYSFRSDVCSYDGTILKSYALTDGAYIRDLAFSEDNTALTVTIWGESEDRTDTIKLK